MADTYTTNLNLTKPEPGAAEDTWGISLNADLDSLDAIFSTSGTQINLNPNQINFADGKKAVFGTGSDLSIYHDGFSSYIVDDGTGDLYIRGADDIRIQGGNGAGSWQSAITVNEAGSVDLFYNGDLKAQTTSSGINIEGDIVLGDNNPSIIMNDSSIANLQHSIVSSSNKLQISTDPNGVHNSSRIEFLVDSTERLQITNTGVDVTGTVTMDGLTVDGNPHISVGDTNTQYIQFGSTEIDNRIGVVAYDNIYIEADRNNANPNSSIVHKIDNKSRLLIQDSGDISFYDDTGTSAALFWDASAESLGIGTTSPTGLLTVDGGTGVSTSGGTLIVKQKGDTSNDGIAITSSNSVSHRIWKDASGKLNIGSFSYPSSFVQDLNGNVGIGTDSPDAALEVNSGGGIHLTDNTAGRTLIIKPSLTGSVHEFTSDNTAAGYAFSNSSSELMRVNSTGLGIGTTSPSSILDLGSNTNTSQEIRISGGRASFGYDTAKGTSGAVVIQGSANKAIHFENTADTTAMVINSTGNVGIGTDSPTSYSDTTLHVSGSTSSTLKLSSDAQGNANTDGFDITFSGVTAFLNNRENGEMQFRTNNSERARIDSSGNFLVGKTYTAASVAGQELRAGGYTALTRSGGNPLEVNRLSSDGVIINLSKDNSAVGSIGTTGTGTRLYIGNNNSSRTAGLSFVGSVGIYPYDSYNQANTDNTLDLGTSFARFKDLHLSGAVIASNTTDSQNNLMANFDSGAWSTGESTTELRLTKDGYGLSLKGGLSQGVGSYATFSTRTPSGTTERMRIDVSGNLLVGKTSANFGSTQGFEVRTTGNSYITADDTRPLRLNRLTSDGELLAFRKDGSTVGSIGVIGGGYTMYNSESGTGYLGVNGTATYAWDATKFYHNTDATGDLGSTSRRFKDLYLSNYVYCGKSTAAAFNTLVGVALDGVNGYISAARSGAQAAYFNRTTSDGAIVSFLREGASVGSVSVTTSATSYNTTSDARLKDVTGEARGLEVITKLNPVAYNWKADGKADEGLIAQEVKELVPNAVTGSEDEHYQMDYSKLVTHLVKGMKEQQEQIEFLKEEIANLKGE